MIAEVTRPDHPVRRALQRGDLKGEIFNPKTGERTRVLPDSWFGAELWGSLIEDHFARDGQILQLLIKLPEQPDEPHTPYGQVLALIDKTLPDFPPRIRRLIEIYYDLSLNAKPNRVDESLSAKLRGLSWDKDSASRGTIAPSKVKFLGFLLQPPSFFRGGKPRKGTRKKTSIEA
jgi:hypothetical protein